MVLGGYHSRLKFDRLSENQLVKRKKWRKMASKPSKISQRYAWAKFFARLGLDQIILFLDGHYFNERHQDRQKDMKMRIWEDAQRDLEKRKP
jgi:hypothetical protein